MLVAPLHACHMTICYRECCVHTSVVPWGLHCKARQHAQSCNLCCICTHTALLSCESACSCIKFTSGLDVYLPACMHEHSAARVLKKRGCTVDLHAQHAVLCCEPRSTSCCHVLGQAETLSMHDACMHHVLLYGPEHCAQETCRYGCIVQ